METKHKSDLLYAISEIEKAKMSFSEEEEKQHYSSARARLDNALRHDSEFLPALFLKARATSNFNSKLEQYNELLKNFPGSKIRNATLYLDIADMYFNKYSHETENQKDKLTAIKYSEKAFSEAPNNPQIIEEAADLLLDLGAYSEAENIEEKLE